MDLYFDRLSFLCINTCGFVNHSVYGRVKMSQSSSSNEVLISRKGSAYLFKAGILKLPSFNGHTFFSRMIAVSYNLTWQSSLSHIYMHEGY